MNPVSTSASSDGTVTSPDRSQIYYWKCDRPAALHGVSTDSRTRESLVESSLRELLRSEFSDNLVLEPGGGKGNHLTYRLREQGRELFVRIEDGPEGDGHLDVESRVVNAVAKTGVSVPRIFFTDATRSRVPFAVQVIEFFDCPDLNQIYQAGRLDLPRIAGEIGRAVAQWQTVPTEGFGPFRQSYTAGLRGYHEAYGTYYLLNLDRHLHVLATHDFLSSKEISDIRETIYSYQDLLDSVTHSCLVHKDLALWNVLGTEKGIRAFIDWDDAVGGDPMDDLSLLGCFYSADIVQHAISGYSDVRTLPENFEIRFWLHLLRNMIVKAVIRCGAGYFNQSPGGAFLIDPGQDGSTFRAFTRQRLLSAWLGLKEKRAISDL